jgi:hypothetical protein
LAAAVIEFEGAAFLEGAGEEAEGVEVGVFGGERAEGEGDAEVLEGVKFFGVQLAGEFFEGHSEGFLEGHALVLGDGFVGDEEGEEFGFGHGGDGEAVHGPGVVVAVALVMVLDGEAVAAAHEFDVALDGAVGDFEGEAEGDGVGEVAGADALVDFLHALEGRAGVF